MFVRLDAVLSPAVTEYYVMDVFTFDLSDRTRGGEAGEQAEAPGLQSQNERRRSAEVRSRQRTDAGLSLFLACLQARVDAGFAAHSRLIVCYRIGGGSSSC